MGFSWALSNGFWTLKFYQNTTTLKEKFIQILES